MTRIILCMIVKNEAHVIERCLTHALPVIDAACICDTGSTDGTPEIIERTLDEAGIPGRVCRHEWVGFGPNRTRSFTEARGFAGELGWDIDDSYALVLDADTNLNASDDFDADSLTADGYSLQWHHGALAFTNTGLLKLTREWRSIGAAHEYWSAEGAGPMEYLDTLWLQHVGDGGVSSEKMERNLLLLESDLRENPDNPRTLFYVAETYFDMGRFEEARRFYLRRVGAGGWEEESWYAAYHAGICSIRMGEWERGAGELLSAWERRPGRAEPLYILAHLARERNAHHIAMMAAERALTIPYPANDRLFIDTHAYREGPIEEISISAYYTGHKDRGAAATDALLHHRATRSNARTLAARNSVYYAESLATPETTKRVTIPFDLWGVNFSPSTGSICRTPSGYALVTRLVNYYQEAGAAFLTRDPGGKYITRNVWVDLDRDLGQLATHLIDDELVDQVAVLPTRDAQVCGVEDIRLFRWRNDWWFVGNSRQFDPLHFWRVVAGRFEQDGTRIQQLFALSYANNQPTEKNWMPLIHEGRLLFVYSRDPLVLLEPDLETGECREVQRMLPPVDLSRTRGSSPMIAVGDRYLGIVHEVVFPGESRKYLHRFVEMDSSLRITRASRPFTFWHRGVEYCCGMSLSHSGDELVISFSWEERESWLLTLPRSQVEAMLLPIDELAFLDPPPEVVNAGSTWLDLSNPEDVRIIQAGVQSNGLKAPQRRARRRRRRLWAPRRRRGSGRG